MSKRSNTCIHSILSIERVTHFTPPEGSIKLIEINHWEISTLKRILTRLLDKLRSRKQNYGNFIFRNTCGPYVFNQEDVVILLKKKETLSLVEVFSAILKKIENPQTQTPPIEIIFFKHLINMIVAYKFKTIDDLLGHPFFMTPEERRNYIERFKYFLNHENVIHLF